MVKERFACPCCGYKTYFEEPNGSFDICQVCFWEDDPIQLDNCDFEGGANRVSLRIGQKNFIDFGACEKEMLEHVRKPKRNEKRDSNWKPIS